MKRFFQLLLVLAVLLAPLTMVGGGAAMAMSHDAGMEVAMDHCAGMDEPSKDKPGADIDCMIACAAIPSLVSNLDAQALAPTVLPPSVLATAPHGLDPESETPPPRLS